VGLDGAAGRRGQGGRHPLGGRLGEHQIAPDEQKGPRVCPVGPQSRQKGVDRVDR
jgi:hypothetical protein